LSVGASAQATRSTRLTIPVSRCGSKKTIEASRDPVFAREVPGIIAGMSVSWIISVIAALI
jgi:hypothetical protein